MCPIHFPSHGSATGSASYGWAKIKLIGPDTADFLQRLSTAYIPQIALHEGKSACFLDPQGKIRASFQVWRENSDEFSLEFDPGSNQARKTALLAYVDRYLFSEKIETQDLSAETSSVVWIFGDDFGLKENTLNKLKSDGNIHLHHHENRIFGQAWVTAWASTNNELHSWLKKNVSDLTEISPDALTQFRIENLSPWPGFEMNENVNPLEAGWANSISPNKGCYPGQEVIEKIISIGAPARKLARLCFETGFESSEKIQAPVPIFSKDGQEIGLLTSQEKNCALGILRRTVAHPGTTVNLGPNHPAAILKIDAVAGAA